MKKTGLFVIAAIAGVSIMACSVSKEEIQTIDLKWKINKNEKLNYATQIMDMDTSFIEVDFGKLFEALSDSTKSGVKESKKFFKKLSDTYKDLNYVTTLSTHKDGVIDIVISTQPKENTFKTEINANDNKKEEEILKLIQSMNQGVMLRGSVYETGGIHSFWVKSDQKNIIAIFFQLPTKPVKIGDKWSLDINLIANDQNFKCDSAYKINEVSLIDIKENNGEKIAVIKYNIIEYVNGDFSSPSFLGNENRNEKSMMKFSYQAIADFSIDKGRWITYDGIMSFEASGVIKANKKTKFRLIRIKN